MNHSQDSRGRFRINRARAGITLFGSPQWRWRYAGVFSAFRHERKFAKSRDPIFAREAADVSRKFVAHALACGGVVAAGFHAINKKAAKHETPQAKACATKIPIQHRPQKLKSCHSERSEESLFVFFSHLNRREILRFAQNDTASSRSI
ncbi:MAG TPA: hypothetical protein VKT71_09345 [Candidatus Acidoferrales bacterium]|nr:hypothetical protein [Candidatus Acidoferrales bacterium]